MITINTYSEKGLVVKGITAEQARTILGGLGRAVTQYNPMLGGYVFSRKRERQIREIVTGMQAGNAEPEAPRKPCYCGTSGVNVCDFCSGMASPDGPRGNDWRKENSPSAEDRKPDAHHTTTMQDGRTIMFIDPFAKARAGKPRAEAADTMPGPWTKNAAGELIG